MRYSILFLLLGSLISGFTCFQKQNTFKNLYALEGTWLQETSNGRTSGESWEKINDSLLRGKGFFIKGTDTIITERLDLNYKNKMISYISTVTNQNNGLPVSFTLTSAGKNQFVFENPEHDFPKRIVYEFVQKDSLHAYIDGGGKRQDFYLKKTN